MKRLFLSVIMVLGLSTVCFSQNKQEINDLNEAIFGNLKLMRSTLSQSQYKKYLQLINAELKNKDLNTYIRNISEI